MRGADYLLTDGRSSDSVVTADGVQGVVLELAISGSGCPANAPACDYKGGREREGGREMHHCAASITLGSVAAGNPTHLGNPPSTTAVTGIPLVQNEWKADWPHDKPCPQTSCLATDSRITFPRSVYSSAPGSTSKHIKWPSIMAGHWASTWGTIGALCMCRLHTEGEESCTMTVWMGCTEWINCWNSCPYWVPKWINPSPRSVTYLYHGNTFSPTEFKTHCCYEKMQVNKYCSQAPGVQHQGECASYRPAIDESDWLIQTVMVQMNR
jgi:hypothetical protein